MGMFDYFRSSYDLGSDFIDVECQTKDIEEGIGGTMSQYWLDPHGYLYLIDYSGTSNFVELGEDDDGYDSEKKWANFRWVPNGNRGKVKLHPITKYIRVYPSHWDGEYDDWPEVRLHFIYGRLADYDIITRDSYWR